MDFILLIIIGFTGTFIGTIAGGGGLISMPSMLLIGVPIHSAIAANKFSNTISSFSSFFVLLRQKKIHVKTALFVSPVAILGGMTGGLIATSLSEKSMTIIAILLLGVALLVSFIKKPKEELNTVDKVPLKVYPLLYTITIYDGMFGPGQATLQMYTYLQNGFSYLSSIALTRFVTFLSCFSAFITYLLNGHIKWEIALFLALGSFIGAQVAVRVAGKLSKKLLIGILKTVTILLMIQLTINLLI
ncbi:sulfite exporter TauE/SafE family protein [Bacillus suaedaesalsae]|uniref:Probable membrane transporter protein n=1 Tax=Bacillus suaedaesalsae TaxID=2810349 RepID=A0ABS2DGK4_9BACI|nr:sulfite exporter TauE/SafE family protein [Bacillus suaedaesalsae]MBM6617619.1 sulfite exporter TauE/SafE family protein [Bacillus suaedaesalsae]